MTPAPDTGWQPISTAPKDGTAVLTFMRSPVSGKGFVNVQTFRGNDAGWCNAGDSKRPRLQQPTHWQPLPPPPETE